MQKSVVAEQLLWNINAVYSCIHTGKNFQKRFCSSLKKEDKMILFTVSSSLLNVAENSLDLKGWNVKETYWYKTMAVRAIIYFHVKINLWKSIPAIFIVLQTMIMIYAWCMSMLYLMLIITCGAEYAQDHWNCSDRSCSYFHNKTLHL